MYASRTTQFLVGIFALAGLAAFVVLTCSLRGIAIFEPSGYVLYANFDNVSGLRVNDAVEMDGRPIGRVLGIRLTDLRAKTTLIIDDSVKIGLCASAKIQPKGASLEPKYISIVNGSRGPALASRDTINQGRAAFVLEGAISSLIQPRAVTPICSDAISKS